MSAIEAFYSTWSQARETFGSGVPQDGSEYDNSNKLRQLQSKIESAKPDDRWQGPAADAYAAKNQQHAATYGKLADLDQRMAAEVGRTSAVVTAGRQNLDQIRDWVTSAARSVPNDRSGENMKLAIASKGINQISEIVKQSNDQMTTIGERIRGLGREYDEIGGDKGKNDLANWKENPPIYTDDDDRTHEEKAADWGRKWAELGQEIEELRRTRPPDGTPPGPLVDAWTARRRELMKKEAELAQEAAELGLEIAGQPPPTVQRPTPSSPNMATAADLPTTTKPRDTPVQGLRRP